MFDCLTTYLFVGMRKMVYSLKEVAIMRKRDVLGPLLVLLPGMIGITFSVFTGSIKVYLIFIVPILVGKGLLAFISIALFFIGAIWFLIAYMKTKIHNVLSDVDGGKAMGKGSSTLNGGGILFIGPIPIVFGNRAVRSRFPRWWVLLLVGIFLFALVNIIIYLVF